MSSDSSEVTFGNHSRYVYVVAGLSALGGLLFGYDTGVISGALLYIREDFQVTSFLQGAIVSSLLVGAMIGALACGPLSDWLGRRIVILVAAIVFGVGALVAALAPNVATLVGGRVILGLAVGMASVVVPLYIAEMAPPDVRGALVTLNQLMITIGILVAYGVNAATAPFEAWRWALGLAFVPAVALGVGMIFLPESPRWLMTQGAVDRARTVLGTLRAEDEQVEREMREIQEAESHEEGGWRELLAPWVWPLVLVGLLFNFFGQASGINTIIYFAPTILERTAFAAAASILATVGIGVVNVLMTLVGMALVDRVGRRPLLLSGIVGMALALVALGFVFFSASLSGAQAWVALACLIVYIASFAVSIGVLIFLIPPEIFPLRVRGKAMGLALLINWGSNFVISLTFLPLLESIGEAATFWLYGGLNVIYLLFAFFFIPETKNRTLEEIEADLRSKRSAT
jgi:sugar porter (SP) family MFS transporter